MIIPKNSPKNDNASILGYIYMVNSKYKIMLFRDKLNIIHL